MKILFIGGTGIISPACVDLSISRGFETYVLNRGNHLDSINKKAKPLIADYNIEEDTKKVLSDSYFDVIVDFRIFTSEDVDKAVRLFNNITKQYIMISSATVYKRPAEGLITEDSPLGNDLSVYATNKLHAENSLRNAISKGFPGVIVRPSLTYSDAYPLTSLRGNTGYALFDRMRKGKQIVIHDDGSNLWTITHNTDFAKGLIGLFGNEKTIGQAFHITQDEVLDWNTIYTCLANVSGVEPNFIHIPAKYICTLFPQWSDRLLGDQSFSLKFDNSKIKKFVPDFDCTIPFSQGAKRSIAWFDKDPATRHIPDPEWDSQMDYLIEKFNSQ